MFQLKRFVRDIPDFPKPGILYRDITPLLQDPRATAAATEAFLEALNGKSVDKVVGIESRGFFFASLLAQKLQAGFVPVRKQGKLPFTTHRESYELEYGKDVLEMHTDAISPGERVLVHDDVLATGGTAAAACGLVRKCGGEIVLCNFLMSLEMLGGRKKLGSYEVHALWNVEG